jgi:hypothetical protein
MVSHWNYPLLVVVLLATPGTAAAEKAATSEQDFGPAVRRAVALLPERPDQVLVLDVNDAKPQHREYLSKLQAFVIRGSAVIYLTKHGEVLREALKGSPFHDHILATVIWHEMAHVAGADEREARRREEALWTRFMLDNAVDRDGALHYLRALKERRPSGVE